MPRKSLKNVLVKHPASRRIIDEFARILEVDFSVINDLGKVIRHPKNGPLTREVPIVLNDTQVGRFCYQDDKALKLLELISHLLELEMEKRRIGTEVLGLYREINMIYNFSEHLAEKLDAKNIAASALHEAAQIIKNQAGWVLLYEEDKKKLKVIETILLDVKNEHSTFGIEFAQSFPYRLTSEIVPPDQLNDRFSAMLYAPFKVKDKVLGILALARFESDQYTAADLKLLTTISLQAASAMETANLFDRNIREVEAREVAIRKIHDVTKRFVPNEFIHALGKSDITQVILGDSVEQEVTVLFADIRDYTSLSEKMSPEDNFRFVNAFNQRMGPIIDHNHGFINQYLGDGFMAIFPKSPQDALQAAVEMQRSLWDYNQYRKLKNRKTIRMGVGMQTGSLIMGITGDERRMAATTISDTVNTAARIEGLSKHYGTSILLSETCKNKLKDRNAFDLRYLGMVRVKGKQQPIKIFECINGDEPDLLKHKLSTMDIFQQGITQYLSKEFAEANESFLTVMKNNPDDKTANFFHLKAVHLLTHGVDENWEGIESMNVK